MVCPYFLNTLLYHALPILGIGFRALFADAAAVVGRIVHGHAVGPQADGVPADPLRRASARYTPASRPAGAARGRARRRAGAAPADLPPRCAGTTPPRPCTTSSRRRPRYPRPQCRPRARTARPRSARGRAPRAARRAIFLRPRPCGRAQQRHGQPQRAVGVLPAVFAQARAVAAHVARLGRAPRDGRVEQPHHVVLPVEQVLHRARERRVHAAGVGVRVEGGKRLRDRVDAALAARFRAERPPVVIVPAPVPRAVPRSLGRSRAVVGGKRELFGRVPAHEGGKFPRP